MADMRTAEVLFQPLVSQVMDRGFTQIIQALRPTLGPRPHMVAIARETLRKGPEFLDSGGIIARRIIELKNHHEDVGAMFLRQMLWRVHEDVGDGVATAAVIFDAVYHSGIKYLAAGGNCDDLSPLFG